MSDWDVVLCHIIPSQSAPAPLAVLAFHPAVYGLAGHDNFIQTDALPLVLFCALQVGLRRIEQDVL